jgi:hypothetical protein
MNNIPIQNVWSPKRLSVTERRSSAPAHAFREAPMNNIPIQNVWSPKRLRASVTERRSSAPACAIQQAIESEATRTKLRTQSVMRFRRASF